MWVGAEMKSRSKYTADQGEFWLKQEVERKSGSVVFRESRLLSIPEKNVEFRQRIDVSCVSNKSHRVDKSSFSGGGKGSFLSLRHGRDVERPIIRIITWG